MEVSDMCLYVRVDGKMCVADLTEIDPRDVIGRISCLFETGYVPLVPLKGEYRLERVGESVDKGFVEEYNGK